MTNYETIKKMEEIERFKHVLFFLQVGIHRYNDAVDIALALQGDKPNDKDFTEAYTIQKIVNNNLISLSQLSVLNDFITEKFNLYYE